MAYKTKSMAQKCNAKYRASEKGAAREKVARKNRTRRSKEIIDAAKSRPCADCGGAFPPCCMDFHHVNGDKKFSIGGNHYRTPTAIAAEIVKCVVICANCHRIRHDKTEGR